MSDDGERSPKRQRLDSYSPASPPPAPETKAFVQPQTPPPSVHMSPSWQSQTSAADRRSTSRPGSVASPTPLSTAGLVGGQRGSGVEEGAESMSHTPRTEAEARRDVEVGAQMTDGGTRAAGSDMSMEDAEHRRSDHERGGRENAGVVQDLPPAPRLYKLRTEREFVRGTHHSCRVLLNRLSQLSHLLSRILLRTSSTCTRCTASKRPLHGETHRVIRLTSCANLTKAKSRRWGWKGRAKRYRVTVHSKACWTRVGTRLWRMISLSGSSRNTPTTTASRNGASRAYSARSATL